MADSDVEIIAELLARIGGSWHPEKPRPAQNGISGRHRDVARLILAALRRSDAARNDAQSQSSRQGPSGTPGDGIQPGAMVAYCPPGDTRTITCRVDRIERDRAFVVPVHPEIGWISTNTLHPLAAPGARPEPLAWAAGQGASHRGGAWSRPGVPGATGIDLRQPARAAAPAFVATQPGPSRESGTSSAQTAPQQAASPRPQASSGGKRPAQSQAPQPKQADDGLLLPAAPAKPRKASSPVAEDGKGAGSVQHFFDSTGQWVGFRRTRTDPYLFNTKGKWIGWFPWKDNEIVDVHGRYLGTVLDTNRIFRKSTPPEERKAGFVVPPGESGYAGYAERVAFCDPPYGFQNVDWKSVAIGRRDWLKSSRKTPTATESAWQRYLALVGLAGLANWIGRTVRSDRGS